jgi:acyl-CoA thioester hydrolase
MCDEIPYSKSFPILWSDLDPNGHMRGPRYLDYAAEMPFHFLVDNGFDFAAFAREKIGPVTFKQEVRHLKEVRFADQITIDYRLRGMSPNGSLWAFRHRISLRDGSEAAIVESEGAFFSLSTRKVTPPPAGLVELLRRLPKDDDFAELADTKTAT